MRLVTVQGSMQLAASSTTPFAWGSTGTVVGQFDYEPA